MQRRYRPNRPPAAPEPPRPLCTASAKWWTPRRVLELCELIGDGFTFKDAGVIMRRDAEDCRAAFARVRASLGWQGTVSTYRGTPYEVTD